MENVKNKQGLYAYSVLVDDTNNTSDVIDRNELQIMIKVAPTATNRYQQQFGLHLHTCAF